MTKFTCSLFFFLCFFCFFFCSFFSFSQEKVDLKTVQIIDSVFAPSISGYMKIVGINSKKGIVNDSGKVILPIIYDEIFPFRGKDTDCSRWDGILKVRKGNLCALTMPDGRPICTFSYEEITYLPETCESNVPESMVVKFKQLGKIGLGDARGNMLIRTSYDDIWLLKDTAKHLVMPEVAVVKKDRKLGLMELRQKLIMKAEYDGIEFLQLLKESDKPKAKTWLLIKVQQGGKWGIINLTTQDVYLREFERIEPFADGLALVQKNRKFGYIDTDSKLKIENQYDYATSFHHKTAIVGKNNRFGLLHADKKLAIDIIYEEIKPLFPTETDDKFLASLYQVRKGKLYGILNADGFEVVPVAYESLHFGKGDYSGIGTKEGKKEEIDMKIPPKK
jgi:hypothetical protein